MSIGFLQTKVRHSDKMVSLFKILRSYQTLYQQRSQLHNWLIAVTGNSQKVLVFSPIAVKRYLQLKRNVDKVREAR